MAIVAHDKPTVKTRADTVELEEPLPPPGRGPGGKNGFAIGDEPADPGEIGPALAGGMEPSGPATGTPITEHKLTGGVVTRQMEGRMRDFVRLILIPYWLELPRSSHKQNGVLSMRPESPGQHPFSGAVILLPAST
eukprot:TRINITY_DN2013_c0_g1_i1.p2 TRINITY_DN2013_c0_g1~~TRINITY_DN2013_c0_g1_i1.p2  ORF type:complete len:136 (+),score=13.89 TRINITY_DN2013_c0_g1_i1:37-444(+)